MQVQARDTLQTFNEPSHYTYTQIRIQVNDVNDETPELKMVFITISKHSIRSQFTNNIRISHYFLDMPLLFLLVAS